MTYKTKNATIVFAFVALLMVAPLAAQEVNGDGVGLLGAVCGFTEQDPPSFGAITRGAASVTEQTATFSPTGASTGTGTIFVAAKDWVGLGSRSSGTITFDVDIVEDDVIVVHSLTYTAKDAPGSTSEFDADGTAIEAAVSLAAAINARDGGATGVIATTGGTNVVTVKSEVRGAGGDAFTLAKTSAGGTAVSGANFANGGTGSTTSHLPAETTKFKIIATATTSPLGSQGASYATKTNMPADGAAAIEIVSGTANNENVEISTEISTAFLTAGSGTVTLLAVTAGDTVTINGITYTADATTTSGKNFNIGGATDILDAAELVIVINANDGTLLTAANSGTAVVTVTADVLGTSGNTFTLSETGTTMTASGTKFTGGTEYLENLPYDGSLTQDLTFTIACEGV